MAEDEQPDPDGQPLVKFEPRERNLLALVLVVIAVVHVAVPTLAIDAVFLGLLAFAAIIYWFDIDRIEWQGIRARRREIEKSSARVREARLPAAAPDAQVPEVQSGQGALSPPAPVLSGTGTVSNSTDREALEPPTHPLERLLWGYEEARIELLLLTGNTGRLPGRSAWKDYSVRALIGAARQSGLVPDEVLDGLLLVRTARNDATHGRPKSADVEAASKLAVDVVSKLREVKHNFIRVRHSDVTLYSDPGLSKPISARGVVLATISRDGNLLHVQVFPRESEYEIGRFVSWEWNKATGVHLPTWYLDPETGGAKSAFSGALTFAGRPYPENWEVKYRIARSDAGLATT